jgi:hypothetical protein
MAAAMSHPICPAAGCLRSILDARQPDGYRIELIERG